MGNADTLSLFNHGDFLKEALLARPPLPVDVVNISGIVGEIPDSQDSVPGYAWISLPRWVTEIEDTFKKAGEGPLVHLDLCSSVPLYAQWMRGLQFQRSGERAEELVRDHYSSTGFMQAAQTDPLLKIIHSSAARDFTLRRLLGASIQEVLYTLNSEDVAGGKDQSKLRQQRLIGRILTQLETQCVSYSSPDNPDATDTVEERWRIKFSTIPEASYPDTLAQLPIPTADALQARRMLESDFTQEDYRELAKQIEPLGKQGASRYIEWQAELLGRAIANNNRYRPARFLSMDISLPLDIAVSGATNAPESTSRMNMFSHAIRSLMDTELHLVGNIFDPLPVPDNSLTLITCYDAWPFYSSFAGMTDEEVETCIEVASRTIESFYRKLGYGGKLVIFPWATQDGDERSNNILRRVAGQLSTYTGHAVDRPIFSRATLEQFMYESDQHTLEAASGIFSGNHDETEALIINKPAKKLVDKHRKTLDLRSLRMDEFRAGKIPGSDNS